MKVLTTMCLIVISITIGTSQITKIDKTKLPHYEKDTHIKYFFNQNEEFIRVIATKDKKIIEINSNNNIYIDKHSYVLGYINEIVFVATPDYNLNTTEVACFSVQSLNKMKNIVLDGTEIYISLLNNQGGIIVSDYWESYGKNISVYSGNLELLFNYKTPFGFESIIECNNNQNKLLLLLPEKKDYQPKLLALNSLGELVTELDLPFQFHNVFGITLTNKFFIINNFQKLIAFGTDGSLIFEKEFTFDTTPTHIMVGENENYVYTYCVSRVLEKIDLSTKKTIWSINLKDYFPKHALSLAEGKLIFHPNSEELFLHVKQSNKNSAISELISISKDGEVITKINLGVSFFNINIIKKRITAYNKNFIQHYETK